MRSLILLLLALAGAPAHCQPSVAGRFDGRAPESTWLLRGAAALTSPQKDEPGRGWLRLTDAVNNAMGFALYAGPAFKADQGLVLSFTYASWGGAPPGADGLTVFLYEAQADMQGAPAGGGLGYCQGAGGWLALALDEFGNFSHPADSCGNGPGPQPQSLVVRGPVRAGHPYVAHAQVPGGIDRPAATQRPEPAQLLMHLVPKREGTGFRINVEWRGDMHAPWRRLIDGADFPFASPAALRVGVAASTGAAKNVHEVRNLSVQGLDPPKIALAFHPNRVSTGGISTLVLQLASSGTSAANLLRSLTYVLPPGVRLTSPMQLGGTCRGEVGAQPGGTSIVIRGGTQLPVSGCSLTFGVRAQTAGQWTLEIPANAWATERGSNDQSATAVLTVLP